MNKKPETIDEHIATFDPAIQKILQRVRTLIAEAAPMAEEKISYGIPTFYQQGNLVHFAGNKSHLGFYPGAQAIVDFQNELKDYPTSKGAIQFPYDQALPETLITRIVHYRLQQNLKKSSGQVSKGKKKP
ncbi:MAG: DUF1801 domain-containing protein [Cytophagaceae bacterium]|jgi:uncharacterized protein YdhG (YjbR/CyaY superfamily)|nr:DUF1801 domain-containing protein [Cytophagaceae bacterium]